MKQGDTVTVVSGPHRGKTGKIVGIPRAWILIRLPDGRHVSVKSSEINQDYDIN
jgi:ribosomal protein L24